MFSPASSALLLAVLAAVQAVPLPSPGYKLESDYAILENYDTYHTRYLAIGCQDKHNTQFFEDCCHPMLNTETLANNRKPYCAPAPAPANPAPAPAPAAPAPAPPAPAPPAPAPPPVVTNDDDDEEDCEDDDDTPTPPPSNNSNNNSTPAPAPAPAPAPEPEQPTNNNNGGNNSGGGDHNGGVATFFYQNGNPGNCGEFHQDSEFLVALPPSVYGSGGNCGRTVVITNQNNGKQVTAVARDSCPPCDNNSLDLSVAAFNAIATEAEGRVPISWSFA